MVKDLFGTLLEELGHAIEIPDLHPDSNNSCQIRLKNGLQVQVELHSQSNSLLIGSDLGAIPLGHYRVDLFREALKANGQPHPQHGLFGYSNKTDHLIIFEFLPIQDITGDKIADELTPFSEKALLWKNALTNNEVPVVSSAGGRPTLGMFGLRP